MQKLRSNQKWHIDKDVQWQDEDGWYMLNEWLQWENIENSQLNIYRCGLIYAVVRNISRARGLGVMTSP